MKVLIVDDDFISRKILLSLLSAFGQCDVAVNGVEALEAFKSGWESWDAYDLICMDIRMPEMDGQECLRKIREIEQEKGKTGLEGVKIIMTTAMDDVSNIKAAFREQCEAYLIKPIEKQKLLNCLKELNLLV